MFLEITLLLVGFGILIKGADFLVNGASAIARKFNVSNLAIGLTVVAFGTSTPELIVSLLSAIEGRSDATFGNIIGSNNFNVMFILGVSGLIYPLVVHRNTIRYEVPFSIFCCGLLYLLANDALLFDSSISVLSRIDSVILLLVFGFFLFYISRTMKTNFDMIEGEIKIIAIPLAAGMVLLGMAMLIGGGVLVVDNSVAIATYAGLSEKLIGITILAIGTSLPELATSAVAAYRKNTDIAIGNVVGSNIFNITFVLGITGIINPIQFNPGLNVDLKILAVCSVVLMIFMFTINRQKLDRWEAFLFLGGYITYIIYAITTDGLN